MQNRLQARDRSHGSLGICRHLFLIKELNYLKYFSARKTASFFLKEINVSILLLSANSACRKCGVGNLRVTEDELVAYATVGSSRRDCVVARQDHGSRSHLAKTRTRPT